MLAEFVAPMRRVVNTLVACRTPPELAAGFTLGMIVGLVPKGNLIALSLCVLLFSLRVNKGLGVASALFFSCFATSIDSFAHKLGLIVLSAESLQVGYANIFSIPLGPWLGFHNTVTCGALLIGVCISYPFYYVTRILAAYIERQASVWMTEPLEPGSNVDRDDHPQPRIAA
jgi:uncharacterized protein (TIGR03546 family)